MKTALIIIATLLYAVSITAQVPVIKIYHADGSVKQYKIEDIETLSFIHFNLSFSMVVYNKNNQPKNEYYISEIDSIQYINNNYMKIYFPNITIEQNITEIDSIIFFRDTICEIKIGNQIWMCKNLDVENYRNGDPIPEYGLWSGWEDLTTGAWCFPRDDYFNGPIYGKLYNWYAVNDPRGLAPEGWHIPTEAEWDTLITYLGGDSIAGGKLKESGLEHWLAPNNGATNESGFTALPAGFRIGNPFAQFRRECGFWTNNYIDNGKATTFSLANSWIGIDKYNANLNWAYSIRCIKDK
jgi:uncharacterized protein (TIGR02145 family)